MLSIIIQQQNDKGCFPFQVIGSQYCTTKGKGGHEFSKIWLRRTVSERRGSGRVQTELDQERREEPEREHGREEREEERGQVDQGRSQGSRGQENASLNWVI